MRKFELRRKGIEQKIRSEKEEQGIEHDCIYRPGREKKKKKKKKKKERKKRKKRRRGRRRRGRREEEGEEKILPSLRFPFR